MRLLVAAVGTRMPGWADEAFREFTRRMPRELPVELHELKAAPRSAGKSVASLLAVEAERIRAALPPRCRVVALDERGAAVTTRDLAARIAQWQAAGDDVALVIGGPDGLADALKDGATESLRLSSLTLPHALARVVLAEALYRAASLLRGHPYHRE